MWIASLGGGGGEGDPEWLTRVLIILLPWNLRIWSPSDNSKAELLDFYFAQRGCCLHSITWKRKHSSSGPRAEVGACVTAFGRRLAKWTLRLSQMTSQGRTVQQVSDPKSRGSLAQHVLQQKYHQEAASKCRKPSCKVSPPLGPRCCEQRRRPRESAHLGSSHSPWATHYDLGHFPCQVEWR